MEITETLVMVCSWLIYGVVVLNVTFNPRVSLTFNREEIASPLERMLFAAIAVLCVVVLAWALGKIFQWVGWFLTLPINGLF